MADGKGSPPPPRVVVIADVESNAQALVERVLKPEGIYAWVFGSEAPPPDVLLVDVTQLRGDPLASLRNYRETGDEAPAILLAAHFPLSRLRELFQLGISDFLLKPYRPEEMCQAIYDLTETRSARANTQILATRMEGMREQLRRRSEEIRMLSEIGRVVVNLDDLNSILRSVVEAAAFVTDAEEANLYLAEPENNELVLRASKQAGERHATLQRLRVNDTLVGEVFHSGQAAIRQPSMEGGPVKVQTGFLVQSTVNVPLLLRNHVVGVLGVYNRLAPRVFNEHHLTLMNALSDWAGVALEQASLKRGVFSASQEAVQVPAASSGIVDGLEQAIRTLERYLDGPEDQAPETGRLALGDLLSHLQGLRSLPVATLDADEISARIDLPGLVRKVTEEMRPEATRRGLELIAEEGDAIPLFRADPSKTEQILGALILAAIRRTKRGRIVLETHRFEVLQAQSAEFPLTVNVDLHDGAWAAVRVSDSSPGLSADTVKAITAPATDPASGKMGPGLRMGEIRMIIESMKGVMWYEHTPASTSITFALPIT